MDKPRVFVSHSNLDNEFTKKLVEDLRKGGAEVWVDYERIPSGNFARSINEGLGTCQWVVLVLTPNALKSGWVGDEIDAAANLKRKKRVRDVIPILAMSCDEITIPPLWDIWQRYDATKDYEKAIFHLIKAIGLPTINDSLDGRELADTVNLTPLTRDSFMSKTDDGESYGEGRPLVFSWESATSQVSLQHPEIKPNMPSGMGSGWLFLPQITEEGEFALSHGYPNIEQSIRLVLLTRKGERARSKDFGSNLHRLTTQINQQNVLSLATQYVREALEYSEPRIELIRCQSKGYFEDSNIIISLDYFVLATGTRRHFDLRFKVPSGRS